MSGDDIIRVETRLDRIQKDIRWATGIIAIPLLTLIIVFTMKVSKLETTVAVHEKEKNEIAGSVLDILDQKEDLILYTNAIKDKLLEENKILSDRISKIEGAKENSETNYNKRSSDTTTTKVVHNIDTCTTLLIETVRSKMNGMINKELVTKE